MRNYPYCTWSKFRYNKGFGLIESFLAAVFIIGLFSFAAYAIIQSQNLLTFSEQRTKAIMHAELAMNEIQRIAKVEGRNAFDADYANTATLGRTIPNSISPSIDFYDLTGINNPGQKLKNEQIRVFFPVASQLAPPSGNAFVRIFVSWDYNGHQETSIDGFVLFGR